MGHVNQICILSDRGIMEIQKGFALVLVYFWKGKFTFRCKHVEVEVKYHLGLWNRWRKTSVKCYHYIIHTWNGTLRPGCVNHASESCNQVPEELCFMSVYHLYVCLQKIHPFSKARQQHIQTVIQPCMRFLEEPCQSSVSQTAESLTCSIMEKPLTGLEDSLNMLLSCFRKRMSAAKLQSLLCFHHASQVCRRNRRNSKQKHLETPPRRYFDADDISQQTLEPSQKCRNDQTSAI